jgi:shikimate kinase
VTTQPQVACRRVVLLGQMGAGKSSVGHELARRLGWRFLDNDVELQRRTGSVAATLAARRGLDRLHAAEADVFHAVLHGPTPVVLAGAASVVDTVQPTDVPLDAFVVWLRAPSSVLARRSLGADHRPRGLETTSWFEQTRGRDVRGQQIADLVVDTEGCAAAEVAGRVLAALAARGG